MIYHLKKESQKIALLTRNYQDRVCLAAKHSLRSFPLVFSTKKGRSKAKAQEPQKLL